jgi:hypothetical protein
MNYIISIIHEDPRLYLSYMAFVEAFTVMASPSLLSDLEIKNGTPRSQMSSIANHGELDREHVVEDYETIARFAGDAELTEPLLEVVRRSASLVDAGLGSCLQ